MWDESDVLLTSSQILMTKMVAYEMNRKRASFVWKTHPETIRIAEEDMNAIEDDMSELGLMPK